MLRDSKRIVFIVSTDGGVLSRLFQHDLVRSATLLVLADRKCGAIDVANQFGVDNKIIQSKSGEEFSHSLQREFWGLDLTFISFYTRLLTKPFLSDHLGIVFNCHPSILPACKGLDGFGDTVKSNSLFMGCTLHEVDYGVGSGMSVIQACIPLNRATDRSVNRQKVFLAQYYSCLQFIRWIVSKKMYRNSSWHVLGARYDPDIFSPNLDSDFFDYFDIYNESLPHINGLNFPRDTP